MADWQAFMPGHLLCVRDFKALLSLIEEVPNEC
jgi:hypothetical protein